MIYRLREKHSPERLAEIYAQPHDSSEYPDHALRVGVTVEIGYSLAEQAGFAPMDVVDLSCGNGKIANRIAVDVFGVNPILGDIAPGYEITGPIEDTIHMVQLREPGLLVLSETLEHLWEPQYFLEIARSKFDYLLLSTPIDEPHNSTNEQHYWSWSVGDVMGMLDEAGWNAQIRNELYLPTYYDFMILGCS